MHKTTDSEKKEIHEHGKDTEQSSRESSNLKQEDRETQQVEQTDQSVCKEEIELLKEKNELIASLQNELAEAKDQYLRKLADYENFRKRMFRERDDAVAYANTQLLTDLVDVLDNFDRAIQSAEVSKDFTTLHDGIVMIQKHFLSLLEGKYGLKRFDSLNAEFDPHKHEAMSSETGDCEHPVVIEEYSKGYMLKDRVLRTARVKVRMPVSGNQAMHDQHAGRQHSQENGNGNQEDSDAAEAGQSNQ